MPTVNAVAEAPTFWPEGGSAVVTVENPDWKIDNELIARITGGKLLGKSAGTTTLTASVGSEKVTVTIEVLPNDNEEDNDPGNNGDGDNDPGNGGEDDNDPGNNGEAAAVQEMAAVPAARAIQENHPADLRQRKQLLSRRPA